MVVGAQDVAGRVATCPTPLRSIGNTFQVSVPMVISPSGREVCEVEVSHVREAPISDQEAARALHPPKIVPRLPGC